MVASGVDAVLRVRLFVLLSEMEPVGIDLRCSRSIFVAVNALRFDFRTGGAGDMMRVGTGIAARLFALSAEVEPVSSGLCWVRRLVCAM